MLHEEVLERLRGITEEEKRILEGDASIDRSIYMEKQEEIIRSSKMLPKGKRIMVRTHTRFVHFPVHSHDFVEIIYMCKGSTTHIVDGERIVLREGEFLFLCQSAKQEILPAGESDIALNFIVCPDFFTDTLQRIGQEDTPLRRFLLECLKNESGKGGYLHFKVADVLPVQNLAENMIYTLMHDTPCEWNINQVTMGLLFLQLTNHTDKLAARGGEEDLTLKVLSYIEENYKSGSLSELSGLLHYDISALSRKIKEKTGKTYTELLHEKRLSQALFLLENTDIKVDDIAAMTGYENISFFYRLFKKKFAISPKKFRDRQNKLK